MPQPALAETTPTFTQPEIAPADIGHVATARHLRLVETKPPPKSLTEIQLHTISLSALGADHESIASLLQVEVEDIQEAEKAVLCTYEVREMAAAVNQSVLDGNLKVEHKDPDETKTLTTQQKLVASLIAQGMSRSEISKAIGKNRSDVAKITRYIFGNFGTRNRSHFVYLAHQYKAF